MSAGQKSGSEAAVHAMSSMFSTDETDAVLLIDATNAFNTLNRAATLHNISILCPIIATFVINTYRQPVRLFVTGGQELKSSDGTTQGDPLSMSIYGISLIPLMLALKNTSNTKQCWLADDASGAGSIKDVLKWWKSQEKMGPMFGYYPNTLKCWLIVKPNKYEEAMEAFQNTEINVTKEGVVILALPWDRETSSKTILTKRQNNGLKRLSNFQNSQTHNHKLALPPTHLD